jgi:hypothetical protein
MNDANKIPSGEINTTQLLTQLIQVQAQISGLQVIVSGQSTKLDTMNLMLSELMGAMKVHSERIEKLEGQVSENRHNIADHTKWISGHDEWTVRGKDALKETIEHFGVLDSKIVNLEKADVWVTALFSAITFMVSVFGNRLLDMFWK